MEYFTRLVRFDFQWKKRERERAAACTRYKSLNSQRSPSGVSNPYSVRIMGFTVHYTSPRIRTIGLQQATSVWTSGRIVYPSRKEHFECCRIPRDFAVLLRIAAKSFPPPFQGFSLSRQVPRRDPARSENYDDAKTTPG